MFPSIWNLTSILTQTSFCTPAILLYHKFLKSLIVRSQCMCLLRFVSFCQIMLQKIVLIPIPTNSVPKCQLPYVLVNSGCHQTSFCSFHQIRSKNVILFSFVFYLYVFISPLTGMCFHTFIGIMQFFHLYIEVAISLHFICPKYSHSTYCFSILFMGVQFLCC